MLKCDFCIEGEGLSSWRRREPAEALAWACRPCHETVQKLAARQARSWPEIVTLEAACRAGGGEVWEADGVDYWYPTGSSSPTSANVRRIEAASIIA
jgi:hypothetical protein